MESCTCAENIVKSTKYKKGPYSLNESFDSQGQPTQWYGSKTWGMKKSRGWENTHILVGKKGLGVRTSNHMVYGDLGGFPL